MGKLTDRAQQFLMAQPEFQQAFPTGGSWDHGRSKHMRITATRQKEDSHFDVYEVQIQLRSDEPLQEDIHVMALQRALKRVEDRDIIRKVILNGHEITNSELALYNSAEINFLVITNIEKT